MSIVTRFAPSPTGFLHVGGLRTALYAFLHAKQNSGRFLLRIEDTDRERLVEGATEDIVSSLLWAGIAPNEGVMFDNNNALTEKGDSGPYTQSARLEIYQKHIALLLEKGSAYHCFCSKERLSTLREEQQLLKKPTGYDGHCKTLSPEEVEQKKADGAPFVIRMNMPKEGQTVFTDIIRGEVSFENKLIDDQVLIKADGFPTYHFAVVVDDHAMKVTHVIRGEEWISSTPKHLVLYDMFGWEPPRYAHLSLFINSDKQKMSKRHGDVSVADFRRKGFLPEALVNFIAFLGWNPGTEQEIYSLQELEQSFSFDRVQKTAAVFNEEKLVWYNKEWMKRLGAEEIARRAVPFFEEYGVRYSAEDLEGIVTLGIERAGTLQELAEQSLFLCAEQITFDPKLLVWKKSDKEKAGTALLALLESFLVIPHEMWTAASIENATAEVVSSTKLSRGDVFWPMRVALSGKEHSPGPCEIAAVLGKEKTISRIQYAIEQLATA